MMKKAGNIIVGIIGDLNGKGYCFKTSDRAEPENSCYLYEC
jgi:hypothetical protein